MLTLLHRLKPARLTTRMVLLVLFSAGLSALLASVAMLAIAWSSAENSARQDAQQYARSLAYAAAAPLTFDDQKGMQEVLSLLESRPEVREAWVLGADYQLLQSYGTTRAAPAIGASGSSGSLYEGELYVAAPVVAGAGDLRVGTVVLHVDLGRAQAELQRQALGALLASLLALLVTVTLSRKLAQKITVPVVQLAKAADLLTRDWSRQAKLPAAGSDEIGIAVTAFNRMVDELARRGAELNSLNEELRQSAAVAEQARQQAEAASSAKTRFLANMSHELRSPLNGVIGAAQLLRDADGDPARRGELVRIIQTSGANLLDLIEKVLDVSRIEAGKVQVEQRPFDLVECVEESLASVTGSAAQKGLMLHYHLHPTVPGWCMGDASRLRQLLQNLLGNAIKFTDAGRVSLSVQAPDEGRLEFVVADTGVGIHPEQMRRIFEPFQQGDGSATRRHGGSGLGLTICREIARIMGGDVEVESSPGSGSRFTLRLPLGRVADAAAARPLDGRVLCFEPDEDSGRSLAALTARLGCRCVVLPSVGTFGNWLRGNRPAPGDLWLVATESAAGGEVLAELRSRVPDARVAVVGNAVEAPVCGVLTRPLTRSALLPLLSGTSAAETHTSVRILALRPRVLLVEDDAVNRLVVHAMVHGRDFECVVSTDGTDALRRLAQEPFDAVLMDWQMPDIDGLDVTRRLRAGMAGTLNQTVAVIALTANAFAEDRNACLAAGMNDFLTKPVQAKLLRETLNKWCRGAADGHTGVYRLPPAAPDGSTNEPPPYDPAALAGMPSVTDSGGGADQTLELLQMFASSARAALPEMAAARARGDWKTLQRHVHTWKSSAAQVGAVAASRIATRIETRLRTGEHATEDDIVQLSDALSNFEAAAQLTGTF
jgi:signal transduction histidine kinase/HPt (histidine-containing phosphotransfer) domain-containing protein/ActR/RegA family two-component response regulator